MQIATLNLQHGGGKRIQKIVEFLSDLDADVLVLTEFRLPDGGLIDALKKLGFVHHLSGGPQPKQNSVLIASRLPFTPISLYPRIVSVALEGLTLIGVYFPQGEAKREVFELLKRELTGNPNALILGDFNTGIPFEDEKGKTFACADAFESLRNVGLVDAWRSRNPTAREFSWYSSHGNGFRIDHAFCTKQLNNKINTVSYVHEPRLQKITDHSALCVVVLS